LFELANPTSSARPVASDQLGTLAIRLATQKTTNWTVEAIAVKVVRSSPSAASERPPSTCRPTRPTWPRAKSCRSSWRP